MRITWEPVVYSRERGKEGVGKSDEAMMSNDERGGRRLLVVVVVT